MMHSMCRALVALMLVIGLSACATAPLGEPAKSEISLPNFNSALFQMQPVMPETQVSELTELQKQEFWEFVNNPKFSATPVHQRVATYIGIVLDQFSFNDKTLNAQQAMQSKSGNCLSLTVLTTAFANLAGVDVKYQLLDQNPVFSIDRNLLVTSDHLRAVLSAPQSQQGSLSFVSRIRIDYFDTDGLSYVDDISTDVQLSLFYSNLAVEHLSEGQFDHAYSYAYKALTLYQANASALNTIGVLHRRAGDFETAELIYRHGAQYFNNGPMFVRNYSALLRSQGRTFELSELARDNVDGDHPWAWVRAGFDAHNNGKYEEALGFYDQALKLAPELSEIYFFASRSSIALGDLQQSKQWLSRALVLSDDYGQRKQYKYKLNTLIGL